MEGLTYEFNVPMAFGSPWGTLGPKRFGLSRRFGLRRVSAHARHVEHSVLSFLFRFLERACRELLTGKSFEWSGGNAAAETMSGDFENWNQESVHKAPQPTYHVAEKKRDSNVRLAVKWLAILAILIAGLLFLMGVIH